jgi:hypothetical protein
MILVEKRVHEQIGHGVVHVSSNNMCLSVWKRNSSRCNSMGEASEIARWLWKWQ